MGKIVIIGAGIGGLTAAKILNRAGYDVNIYEKKDKKELGYHWSDEVATRAFNEKPIQTLDKKYYHKKNNWILRFPKKVNEIKLNIPYEQLGMLVDRKELINHLINQIGNTKIYFNTSVDKVYIKDDKVKGVIINNKIIEASLVIDNSGVISNFKKNLPKSYFIEEKINNDDLFCVYRNIYKSTVDKYSINPISKVYIKHLNRNGISWFIVDDKKDIDILVGKLNSINEDEIRESLDALCEDNKCIKKEIKEKSMYRIPVRYPLSKMVGNGYVAIGDSAYMTIPILGSGIENSINAGQILGETIVNCKNNPLSIENIWQYQVKYYKEYGYRHCAIDVYKRWLMYTDNDDLNKTISSGLVGNKEFESIMQGEIIKLSLFDYFKKAKKGIKNKKLLFSLLKLLINSKKAMRIAKSIPKTYNEDRVNAWARKIDKFYQNLYIKKE